MNLKINQQVPPSSVETFKANTSYYLKNYYHNLADSIFQAIPAIHILGVLSVSLAPIFPETFYDDTEEEISDFPHTFVIQNSSQIKNITQFYVDNMLEVSPEFDEPGIYKEKLFNLCQQSIQYKFDTLEKLNIRHGINAKLAVTMSKDKIGSPGIAYAGVWSYESSVIDTPMTPTEISKKDFPDPQKQPLLAHETLMSKFNMTNEERDFILAHEFSHVLHNDPIKASIVYCVQVAFTTLPWVINYSPDFSWTRYTITSYAQSLFLDSIYAFFADMLFRRPTEARADQEAIEMLGTASGAIKYFENVLMHPNPPADFRHPSDADRLRAAQKQGEQLVTLQHC